MSPEISTTTLLSTADAASYLGLAPQTLSNWASEGAGAGPAFVQPGGRHRPRYYDQDELDRWLCERALGTIPEPRRATVAAAMGMGEVGSNVA